MFVVTTRRAPINSITYKVVISMIKFLQKGDYYLLLLTVECCFFYAWSLHGELTKNTSSLSQLSYKLEKDIVKLLTLTGKETQRNTRKKLSRTYHLIMSIFSLFYFVGSMKILASISM